MYASDIMISSLFFFKMEGVWDPNCCGVKDHVFIVASSSMTRVDVDFML